MKLLWLDLNSSYAHASLALPAIQAQQNSNEQGIEWVRVSATINSNVGSVVTDIIAQRPDILAATAWLFTHEVLLKIVIRVKALLPDCVVIFGGPEMLGNNEFYLRQNPFVNCVFRGEGELGFHEWLRVCKQPDEWKRVTGLCWLDEKGEYHDGGLAKVINFDQLVVPEKSPFFDWSKPFVQLETTRGCFNTCAFCVSGREKPVRLLPVEQVRKRLQCIRDHGIRDVRLLDRTFNGSSQRAIALLNLFREFAGEMHFHLEIHPGLLAEEVMALLRTMPTGLLHLEAGIQSLKKEVLVACQRLGDLNSSLRGLQELSALPNLVVHADLIAGLPFYSLQDILDDVRVLVHFGTGEIQLELLKLLPGTMMRRHAGEWGIVFAPDPPYEVLASKEMSVEDMRWTRLLSRLIDGFYNVRAWQQVMRRLITEQESFLFDFLVWLEQQDILEQPLSLEKRGVLLYTFCQDRYSDYLTAISVAWISAGIPFAKEPGGKLEAWNGDLPDELVFLEGYRVPVTRLYRLITNEECYWFGFDRGRSRSKPLFIAKG